MKLSSCKMSASNIVDFLQNKVKENTTGEWAEIEQHYNRKLWHQLTLALMKYMKKPEQQVTELKDIYDKFICTFETKINPLALVEIVEIITSRLENKKEAIQMLSRIEPKVRQYVDAESLCKVLQGQLYLQLNDLAATKVIVRSFELEEGVTPIQGRIYKLAADYYRITDNVTKYYRAAIQYVGCDESTLTNPGLARSLAIAAVVSPDIFDLSELVIHPIMKVLKGHSEEWALQLLAVVAGGDLSGYDALKHVFKPKSTAVDEQIKTKIRILCLLEMATKCPITKRVLSFKDIAEQTQIPEDQVEFLIMKAMAKKMMRGKIDEVDKVVIVSWVKPRALSREKLLELTERVEQWRLAVGKIVIATESSINELSD